MRGISAALLLGLTGCLHSVPPTAIPPRPPVPVRASFSRTWEAAVDAFSDKTIPIKTIDRSSGLIVGEQLRVPPPPHSASQPSNLADCGQLLQGTFHQPRFADYNVRIRGDSSAATVLVTVRWTAYDYAATKAPQFDCVSRGVWEREFELAVKDRAERRSPR